MVWRMAQLQHGFTMAGGWVTFIAMPVVFGMFRRNFLHIIVAVGFGKDRCCRNTEVLAIALYDAGVRRGAVFIKPVAINN